MPPKAEDGSSPSATSAAAADAAYGGGGSSLPRGMLFDGKAASYSMWLKAFEMWVQSRGYLDILDASALPVAGSGDAQVAARKAYTQRALTVGSWLLAAWPSNVAALVQHLPNDMHFAHAALKLVSASFQRTSSANQSHVLRQLHTAQMSPGETVLSYAARIQTLVTDLQGMGETVTPAMQLFVLSEGLPKTYAVAAAFVTYHGSTMTFDTATNHFADEQEKQRMQAQRGGDTQYHAASMASESVPHHQQQHRAPQQQQQQQQRGGGSSAYRGGGRGRGGYRGGGGGGQRGGSDRGDRLCYACNLPGHSAYECVKNRDAVKCTTCRMLGHTLAQCTRTPRNASGGGDARGQQQQAQMAYEMEQRGGASSATGSSHSYDNDGYEVAWSAVVVAMSGLGVEDEPAPSPTTSWIMDTGATMSLTNNRELLHDIELLEVPITIRVANNEYLTVEYVGRSTLRLPGGRGVTLQHVGLHPRLAANLLSVAAITRRGFDVVFGETDARIVHRASNLTWTTVPKEGNMFIIKQADRKSVRGPTAHLADLAGGAPQQQQQLAIPADVLPAPSAVPASTSMPGWLRGIALWHLRFGHLGMDGLYKLSASQAVVGLPTMTQDRSSTRDESESECGGCAAGKSHAAPLSHALHDAARPTAAHHLGERMSADLCGPVVLADGEDNEVVSVPSSSTEMRSTKYVSLLIDEYSRRVWVMLLPSKAEAATALMKLLSQIRSMRAPGGELVRVGELHTDGGSEYKGAALQAYFTEAGIRHTTTVAYTPQHNGIAERMNRTLLEMARAMLHHARLPTVFWGPAIMTAAYVRNRCTTRATAGRDADGRARTPMELWTGEKPSIERMRVFGSDGHINITGALRGGKVDATSHPCIMLGVDAERRGHRVFDLTEQRVVVQRSVTCNENVFANRGPALMAALGLGDDREDGPDAAADELNQPKNLDYRNAMQIAKALSLSEEVERQRVAAEAAAQPQAAPQQAAAAPSDDEEVSDEASSSPPADVVPAAAPARVPAPPVERRAASDRVRNPPRMHNVGAFAALLSGAPESFAAAMRRPDASKWLEAMRVEMAAHETNGTWELVPMPPGRGQPMGNKWVFALKLKADGSVERYKARVVAKGFTQVFGRDYTETYSPTMRYKALRVLLAVGTAMDYEVDQMDVTTAFLNATMREEVYMTQPEGFETVDLGSPRVCRLRKTLYGTRQASREWYLAVSKFITRTLGYTACASDPCVYWRRSAGGRVMWIGLFVDDLVIVYSPLDRAEWAGLKATFMARYASKDMGAVQLIVGMRITRDRAARMTRVDQEVHIREMLKRFDMAECRAEPTPEASGVQLTDEDGAPLEEYMTRAEQRQHAELREQYQSIVGSLLYIALACRPDIAHAVSQLGRFVTAPGMPHMVAAKRVLRYLRGTMSLGLVYSGAGLEHVGATSPLQVPVFAYTDADWAGCVMSRRSTTGYLVYAFGGLVSWSATRQKTVALSSAESEYMALSETTTEVKWMHALLADMQCRAPIVEDADTDVDVQSEVSSTASVVYIDSQSAMAMAAGGGAHGRTKHIDARHHFVRNYIRAGHTRLEWVPTADQLADVLTKALPAVTFIRLRDMVVAQRA